MRTYLAWVIMISVLYVDDEAGLLEVARIYLQSTGEFSVDTVPSAELALEKLHQRTYDVIISDYQMPEMDGIQFLQKLRSEGNKTPFIIFTGRGREEVVIQALNSGADFYLQKGGEFKSQFAELQSKIKQATYRQRAEARVRYLNRVYALLSQVNEHIVRISNRDDLFRAICATAVEQGKFRMAWIGLIDERSRSLVPVASAGTGVEEYLRTIPISIDDIPEGRGPSGRAAREGRSALSHDIWHDPLMLPWQASAEKFGYRSLGAFPIRCRGEVRGVFTLSAMEPEFFSDEEVELLEEVAADISFSLDTMELDHQRRTALEALSHSEEQYRMLFETMAQGVVYLDSAGKIIRVNPAAERILGLSCDQMLGGSASDPRWRAIRDDGSVLPDDENYGLVALRTGRRQTGTMGVFNLIDGNSRWLIVTSVPQYRPGEEAPFQVFSTMEDITDRKEKEDELRSLYEEMAAQEEELRQNYDELDAHRKALARSEERLKFALEGANDGLWDVRMDTLEVYLSPRGCEILGYRPDELPEIARVWSELVHPDDLPATQAALDAYLEGRSEIFSIEQRLRTKSGTWKWILARGKVVVRNRDGRPVRMTGTHTDITEQRGVQDALHASEEKFRLLVENAPDAIFVQKNLRFAYLNTAALTLFGAASPDVLIGQPVIDRFHPDYRERVAERILHLNVDRQQVPLIEEVILRIDGTPVDVEVSAVPFFYDNQNGALVFMRDITGREKSPQECIQSSEEQHGS